MAKAPARPAKEVEPHHPEPTPLERMTELTRRVVNVPKAEAIPAKARRNGEGH